METSQSVIPAQAESVEEIFTQLVHAHVDELYNYASYMVFDRDDADDIVQKTFISLHQQLSKLDMTKPIKPWLFRVAKNQCLDYFKAKKASVFSELSETFVEDIPESAPGLDEQLSSDLFLEQVREQIKQLPLPAREILLLKYFEEFTFEEIADILSLPVNTVKTSFYRGKVKLLRLLEDSRIKAS